MNLRSSLILAALVAVPLSSCRETKPAVVEPVEPSAPIDPSDPVRPIDSVRPVAPTAPSLLLTGIAGGPSLLGELRSLPLDGAGAGTPFHTFTGTPWIDNALPEAHGLAWNPVDHKFYGVLNGGGAFHTGVVVSFDPATDAVVMLKTISGREFPDATGLNGDRLPFHKAQGFYGKPLPTRDGKGLLLLASEGGVEGRGLLLFLDIDPESPRYLQETVVYDFFAYEVSQQNYCNSLRAYNFSAQTELAWGKDLGGADVVFMGRNGDAYVPGDTTDPTRPGTCYRTHAPGGVAVDEIRGRMFALKPTTLGDPSQPWTYALGYPGSAIDPYDRLGRQLFWDGREQAIRWTTESVGGGALFFFEGENSGGATLFHGLSSGCQRLHGLLPLDASGNALATCSGVNAGPSWPELNVAPRVFEYATNFTFREQAVFGDWGVANKFVRGATSSVAAHRLFVNGGSFDDQCFVDQLGCEAASTIEEVDPTDGYARQALVTARLETTGRFFLGDPAVGDTLNVPGRYLAWFGAEVKGHSNTLNKFDRSTGQLVTLPLDPVAGAHPLGKLLDLGNGTALGLMDRTPPERTPAQLDLPGGYGGSERVAKSYPGAYLLDLASGSVLETFSLRGADRLSLEPVRLDDGSLWAASADDTRLVSRLDVAAGTSTPVFEKPEHWNYTPADPFTLAGRQSALYLPLWESSVTPASGHAVNVTLGCLRPGAPAVESVVFGPAKEGTRFAHRFVYGATYSPADDAMYLATARVADRDEGTIFEIDKGVAEADLCKAPPVVTALVTGLADVPSTRPVATRAGALFYGTANGKLMRLDPAAGRVTLVADLKGAAASSQVRGYLAEASDGALFVVVYDYDAAGRNIARRLVRVDPGVGAVTSRDVTALLDESEPYPGVLQLN